VSASERKLTGDWIWWPKEARITERCAGKEGIATRGRCDNALLQFLIGKSAECMAGATHLECANPLVIFAFEEEIDAWPSWSLSFIWCAD
jgi:hypothetical protein